MTAVGVDACKRGWVAVVLRDGDPPVAHVAPSIAVLADAVPDAEVIGIDIPIGLPEDGARRADLATRARLGPRRSSLFVTPVRAALEAPTHAAASAAAVERTGSGISQQAFGLKAKILEVDRWFPSATCRVVEVHPELSFTVMRGSPAAAPKKTWQGLVERLAALRDHDIQLDAIDPRVGALVPVDDLVDAAAAAWSARRVLRGEARSLPDPEEVDGQGRPMAIWA